MAKSKPADQNPAPSDAPADRWPKIRQFILARRDCFAQQGALVPTWRTYRGRSLGPYYCIVSRESGRQRSLYLGRSVDLAARAKLLLEELHGPRDTRQLYRRLIRQARAELRRHKAFWMREIGQFGLWGKGFEIRGWSRLDVPKFARALSGCQAAPRTTRVRGSMRQNRKLLTKEVVASRESG